MTSPATEAARPGRAVGPTSEFPIAVIPEARFVLHDDAADA